MKKLQEKIKNVNFGPQIPHFLHSEHNKNFSQKKDSIDFLLLLNPNLMQKKIDKSNALVIRDGRYRQTRVRYSKCYKLVDGRISRAKFIGTFSRGRDQIKWITRVLKLILYILMYVLHTDLNIFYQIKGLHIGSDSALIVFYSLFIFLIQIVKWLKNSEMLPELITFCLPQIIAMKIKEFNGNKRTFQLW